MKIKSFKQFLTEMPLPIGHEPEEFDSKAGKYSSAKIIKAFESIGVKIGKGSSRVAFKVDVEASQFDPEIIKEYGLTSFAGMVTTVFKLALNPKGIAQNAAEVKNFNNAKDYGYEQYLLPILDTSTRNKKYTYADEELSNWIQMPLAPPPSKAQFKQLFEKMYGTGVFGKFIYSRDIQQLRNLKSGSIDDMHNTVLKFTNQQADDFSDFLSALESLEIGIGDLGRAANWGVWNGKLYIIDFGYDDSTANLYNGTQTATVYVDGKGDMTMQTQKNAPRNRW